MLFQPNPRLIARVNYKCGIEDSPILARWQEMKLRFLKHISNSMGYFEIRTVVRSVL